MSVAIRPMKAGEEAEVARFVHRLASDLKLEMIPQLTGEKLASAAGLVSVMVAEHRGSLCGACLSLETYSTFRAERGMYVVDLFVSGELRGQSIGQKLLAAAARVAAGKGARFVKLEVDVTNTAGAHFYDRLGFVRKHDDRLFFLEGQAFSHFVNEG